MPQALIPSDFDGENWLCVRLQWPNSPEWLSILNGLMTAPLRGRFWAEHSGSITDVQAVGREIWYRNHPWLTCYDEQTGEGGTTVDSDAGFGGAACLDVESIMPCIDISRLLQVKNGKLYAKNDCCEWVLIGEITGSGDTLPDTDLPDNPELTDLACRKADAFATMFDLVCNWGVDNWEIWNPINVFSWMSGIQNAFSSLSLERKYLLESFYILLPLKNAQVLGQYSEAIPAYFVTYLACGFQKVLSSDSLEVTATEYEAMKNVVRANASGLMEEYFNAMMNAFGVASFRVIAQDAQFNDAADCGCPDIGGNLPTEPTANGWYLSQEYSLKVFDSGAYNTPGCLKMVNQHDAFGYLLQCDWDEPDTWNLKRMSPVSAGCSTYTFQSWGDTSDHLEAQPKNHKFAAGHATVLDELLGAGNYTQQSSNFGEDTNPATGGIAAEQVLCNSFFGDDMEPGKYYMVKMRLIYNVNSPSHS